MKTLNKHLIIILAIILCMALISCDSKTDDKTDDKKDVEETETVEINQESFEKAVHFADDSLYSVSIVKKNSDIEYTKTYIVDGKNVKDVSQEPEIYYGFYYQTFSIFYKLGNNWYRKPITLDSVQELILKDFLDTLSFEQFTEGEERTFNSNDTITFKENQYSNVILQFEEDGKLAIVEFTLTSAEGDVTSYKASYSYEAETFEIPESNPGK